MLVLSAMGGKASDHKKKKSEWSESSHHTAQSAGTPGCDKKVDRNCSLYKTSVKAVTTHILEYSDD